MSRKDYVEAARILRDTPMPAETRAALVGRFVTFFADDNAQFSPSKFREAAYPVEDKRDGIDRIEERATRILSASDDNEPTGPVAITEEQRELFDALRDPEYGNFALVSTALDGEPTAAIAAITENEFGDYEISPVALLVTDGMFGRLAAPDAGL
jgi:hypothetical protein